MYIVYIQYVCTYITQHIILLNHSAVNHAIVQKQKPQIHKIYIFIFCWSINFLKKNKFLFKSDHLTYKKNLFKFYVIVTSRLFFRSPNKNIIAVRIVFDRPSTLTRLYHSHVFY